MNQSASAGNESIRCSDCGGLNPSGADWCGQCHKRFTPPPPPPPKAVAPPPLHVVEPSGATSGGQTPVVTSTPPPADVVGTRRGAFAVTEQGVTWTCKACESENPIEIQNCSVCGTPLADTLRPPGPERPSRDPATTALVSLIFPGAGHAYLQLWPQAIARGIIQAWVLTVAGFGLIAGSLAIGIFYGLAAFALWLVSAHDAFREASGHPGAALIKGRAFLWIVLGLLAILMMALVLAAFSAPSSAT